MECICYLYRPVNVRGTYGLKFIELGVFRFLFRRIYYNLHKCAMFSYMHIYILWLVVKQSFHFKYRNEGKTQNASHSSNNNIIVSYRDLTYPDKLFLLFFLYDWILSFVSKLVVQLHSNIRFRFSAVEMRIIPMFDKRNLWNATWAEQRTFSERVERLKIEKTKYRRETDPHLLGS